MFRFCWAGVWPRANSPVLSWRFVLCIVSVLLLVPHLTGSTLRAQANPGIGVSEDDPSAIPDSLAFELLRMLAREDTLGGAQIDYILGEFVDSADRRPSLKEIIGWCIESEENRFDGLDDAQFLRRFRTIEFYGDPKDPDSRRVLTEEVEQVYLKPPDQSLTIRLGERSWDSEESETEEDIAIKIEAMQSDLSNLPFFFQELDAFDFSILERRIFSDRILYRIAFEPRSAFDPLPQGTFLIDTANFQILRAEYRMTQNLPFPIFLKAVDKVVIQKREEKGYWFVESVQLEISLRKLPISLPQRIELDIQIEDLRVNEGIADSVWVDP